MASPQIATIKTFTLAAGWLPKNGNDKPPRIALMDGYELAKKQGFLIAHDGRAYVPFQRFVKRSLRPDRKMPG
jgi:hypothetical protein